MFLNEICSLLETYSGRDKIVRTVCYSTKLISDIIVKDEILSMKFKKFSKHMSATRAVLRLFDDLPMLKCLLEYGWGTEEPDKYMASLGVVTNVIDQVYYPIEKVAWLAENDLLKLKNYPKWELASTLCWVVSIYLTLLRSLRFATILQNYDTSPVKDKIRFTPNELKARIHTEMLTCIRLSLDLVHAVSCLPNGYLWSGRFKSWQINLIATISSFLGLYQLIRRRALAKKR